MAYFKLIDAIDVPLNLNLVKQENGKTVYQRTRLVPGKKYAISDDKAFMKSLLGATDSKRYTQGLENRLKACGAIYEIKKCRSCGGRIIKIVYHVVEVVE